MSFYDASEGGYRIFVGDLGPKVSKQEFRAQMDLHGHVISTWIARNPPGFAFAVFKYAEEAERAVNRLHGTVLCGRAVRVEHARPFQYRLNKMNSKYQPRRRQMSRSTLRGRSRTRSRPYYRQYSHHRRSRERRENRSRSWSRSRSRRHRYIDDNNTRHSSSEPIHETPEELKPEQNNSLDNHSTDLNNDRRSPSVTRVTSTITTDVKISECDTLLI